MRKNWKLFAALTIAVSGAIAGVTIVPSIAATSAPRQFFAVLNGGQQAPAVDTTAFGVAHMTFDAESRELCLDMTTSDFTSPITEAHYHRGLPGESPANNIVAGIGTTNPWNDICRTLTKADAELLNKRRLYLNVHTEDNPTGEIRGQILK